MPVIDTPISSSIRFLTYRNLVLGHLVPFIAIGSQARGRLVFPNLRSFECFGDLPRSTRRFRVDLPNKDLRHLTLVYQCSRLFPPVEHLPQLKSLHILLSPPRLDNCVCPNCLKPSTSLFSGPYNSISRLSIEANEFATWPTSIWKSLQFPNLKVFSCRDLGDDCVYPVYAFVQRHSKLLQVNVAFKDKALRLEGLIKLIQGTGKWEVPDGADIPPRVLASGPNDALDVAEFVHYGGAFPSYPDDIPGPRIVFPEFGFIREPIRMERPSRRGLLTPQYKTTALALRLVADIHGIDSLSEHFPDVEEVRLESYTTWSDSFRSWTVSEIPRANRPPLIDFHSRHR